jgi:putative transposase
VLRSDNGLIFHSKRFRAACRHYRPDAGGHHPYTPEQNGVVERWFRSLKEECVWGERFANFAAAPRAIAAWIAWYNEERPHQALGYRSPEAFRARSLRAA